MEDVANLPSDGGSDTALPVAEVSAPAPARSPREALERSFEKAQPFIDEWVANRDPNRDESGRFKAKGEQPAQTAEQPAQATEKPADAQEAAPAPATPAAPTPPSRLSKAAQEAWSQAPDVLRAEVVRMQTELEAGLEKYRVEAKAFEPLRPFDEMARQGGTTLDKALSAYVNMENLIRQDPVRGMMEVCKNAGIDPRQIGEALMGQQPSGGASPEVAALKAEIAALKQEVTGVSSTFKQRDALSTVQEFAAKHEHFEILAPSIEEMLRTGYAKDLQDAYAKALKLNADMLPAKAEPPPQPTEPAPHTRKASLSVTGTPAAGSNPASRKPAGSTREILAHRFAQVGL
jgi:hypothetical protein